jgi:1-acyl-sn-glycerol-3-phosphate acyltransferase
MNPRINHPFFLVLRAILKIPVRIIFRLQGFRVIGKTNLPGLKKAFILICNHAAFVDSVYLIAAVPRRFVICGAKPKYFEKRIMRFLLRMANILKVENEAQFKRDCAGLLKSGNSILIYPEMGRNKETMGPFKEWAAEVAIEAAADVIPCYLYGTTTGQEGTKRLSIGPALVPGGTPAELTGIFRESIEALQPGGEPL